MTGDLRRFRPADGVLVRLGPAVAALWLVGGVVDLRPVAAVAALTLGIVVAELSRRANLWRHALSPLGAFTWMYLPLTLGGMTWLYARRETTFESLGVVLMTFLFIHAGAFVGRSRVQGRAPDREVRVGPSLFPAFALLSAGLLAITAFAVIVRPNVPLLELIAHPGDFLANNQWRFQYTTGTPGFTYLSQAFGNGLPFMAVLGYLAARSTRSPRWIAATLLLTVVTALVLVLSTQRAPVLWFFLLFVVAADAKSDGVSRRRLVLFGAAVAVVMFGVLALRTVAGNAPLDREVGSAIIGALDRLFLVQNRVADFVVQLPTGWGSYLASDLVALRPGPDLGFSAMVYNLLLPGSAVQGTAPSIFTAQLYADFSWLGVAVGGGIVGYGLVVLEGLSRRATSAETLALVVALTLAVARMQQVDVVSATFDFGVIAYLACWAFLVAASRFVRPSGSTSSAAADDGVGPVRRTEPSRG